MNLSLFASLLVNIGLLLIIFGQSKKISALRTVIKQGRPYEQNADLMKLVQEKVRTIGDIKTVKFLRETRGMSMVDAKQLVDAVNKR